MDRLCEDRVVIITGGGRGIGQAHAMAFAAEGAKVVVNDLGAEIDGSGSSSGPAGEVVDAIRAAGGKAMTSRMNRERSVSSTRRSMSGGGSTPWSTTPGSCGIERWRICRSTNGTQSSECICEAPLGPAISPRNIGEIDLKRGRTPMVGSSTRHRRRAFTATWAKLTTAPQRRASLQ